MTRMRRIQRIRSVFISLISVIRVLFCTVVFRTVKSATQQQPDSSTKVGNIKKIITNPFSNKKEK